MTEYVLIKQWNLVVWLYRQRHSWADTNAILLIDTTCIHLYLEYACQLWDPFISVDSHWKLCRNLHANMYLKIWELDYNTMLQLLNLPTLSVYLERTTVYNIVNVFFLSDSMHIPIACIIPLFLM